MRTTGRKEGGKDANAFSPHTIITDYPAPVAIPYQVFCREREPAARMQKLFGVAERLLRYLFCLGFADMLRIISRDEGKAADLAARPEYDFLRREKKMSMGLWLAALRETGRFLGHEAGDFFKEFPAACGPESRFMAIFNDRICTERNRAYHEEGGFPPSPDECSGIIKEVRPALESALREVAFIREYPLGFVKRVHGLVLQKGESWVKVHSCMGANASSWKEAPALRPPSSLHEEEPFVVHPDGKESLHLWPLLGQQDSKLSGRPTIFIFESVAGEKGRCLVAARYAAIDAREPWNRTLHKNPASDFGWLFQEFNARRMSAELPPCPGLVENLRTPHGQLTGRKLGPYTLQSVIDRGGFGTIYKGIGNRGEIHAVKVLETQDVSGQILRFRKEFRKMKKAGGHPGILKCFEMGDEILQGHEWPWYSMEFACGGDLAGRIRDRRDPSSSKLPWNSPPLQDTIIGEFREILSAVEHLHSMDIVHRDIKPGNVLIMEDGRLRLSDFGLVKNLSASEKSLLRSPPTSTGAVMGTRAYMAPEQEQGRSVSKSADVYSLGILLAELMTGVCPAVGFAVSSGTTVRDENRLTSLPPPLRNFIHRCTDANPERRFADAGELGKAFDDVLCVKPEEAVRGSAPAGEQAPGTRPLKGAGAAGDADALPATDINPNALGPYATASGRGFLPLCLVLDVSASMAGENIESLNFALRQMVRHLAEDERRGKSFLVSIITFSDSARLFLPPTPASSVKWTDLAAGGSTYMDPALVTARNLIEEMNRAPSCVRRPTVVLVSDGQPLDSCEASLEHFQALTRSSKCDPMALSIGEGPHGNLLARFISGTRHRVQMARAPWDIFHFFQELTHSLLTQSYQEN